MEIVLLDGTQITLFLIESSGDPNAHITPPKIGVGGYFGKRAYFKLKDRDFLFYCGAGLFLPCTQQILNIL